MQLLIFPVTYSGSILVILLASFFIHFVVVANFCKLCEQAKVNMVSIFHFLETDIREKQYEMRTQTSLINAVNDLRYEIKFEIIMRIHITTNKYTVKKYEK